MDTLKLLLPVMWALVATAIGLLLYKTSRATIDGSHLSDSNKVRVRFLGSVAIAALAFFAMKWATPESSRRTNFEGLTYVAPGSLEQLQRETLALQRTQQRLAACLAGGDAAACLRQLEEATSAGDAVSRSVEGLVAPPDAPRPTY